MGREITLSWNCHGRAEPSRAEPSRAEPSRAERDGTGPGAAELGNVGGEHLVHVARPVDVAGAADRRSRERTCSLGAHRGPDEPAERAGDDRLRLIFTCCHPALSPEARVALTLRTLAGLMTAEVARTFLVREAAMAKRLVRAKHKIQRAGIPYRVPPPELLAERTGGVLAVLYLVFDEGYAASRGDGLVRADLCGEAIRLAEALAALLPEAAEVAACHARSSS